MALHVPSYYLSGNGEMKGFPKSVWKDGQFAATRRMIVDWDERVDQLLLFDTVPGCYYPYSEGLNTPAREAQIWPLEGAAQTNAADSDTAEYEKAVIQVKYSTRGPTWYNSNLIHEVLKPNLQTDYVAPDYLYYSTGGKLAYPLQHLDYHLDYLVTYYRCTTPASWIETYTNYTNSNAVTSPTLGYVFAPYTLLYKGATIAQDVSIAGIVSRSVTAHFEYNPQTWRKYWNPKGGGGGAYDTVHLLSAGGTQYIDHSSTSFGI